MASNGIPGLGLLASAPAQTSTSAPIQPEAACEHAATQEENLKHIQAVDVCAEAQPDTEMGGVTDKDIQLEEPSMASRSEVAQDQVLVSEVQQTFIPENEIAAGSAIQSEVQTTVPSSEESILTLAVQSNTISPEGAVGGQTAVEVRGASNDVTESVANFEETPSVPQDEGSPPQLFSALEALLGLASASAPATAPTTAPTTAEITVTSNGGHIEDVPMSNTETSTTAPAAQVPAEEEEHPEWEVDSSPIESSSDDSSSDDSESEAGEDTYKLLSPEEQARILMEGDGDSGDEGKSKAQGSGAHLRTKNEVPEEVVPKPDVVITAEMKIEELGQVEHIVDNIAVIKAKTSGEYRVLEVGSVLCLPDRTVIGAVSETLGRVQNPLYCVRFTNAAEITAAGLSLGTSIFYSETHSTYVFTQSLKAFKGSDASNLHDEEVGDEEVEFSDDEAEAEHKRSLKQKRQERRGGKAREGGQRGEHPLQQTHLPGDAALKYDDDDQDEPYKPLARPSGFAENIQRGEAPLESSGPYTRPRTSDGSRGRGRGGRGRGEGRGRGDRGRGDRGRGRGGSNNNNNNNHNHHNSNGYSAPQSRPGSSSGFAPPPSLPHPFASFPGLPYPPIPPPNFYPNHQTQPQTQPQPQAGHNAPCWPQYTAAPPFPFPGMQNWSQAPPPQMPSGGFLNPAFWAQAQANIARNGWAQNQGQNQGGGNANGHGGGDVKKEMKEEEDY